MMVFSLSAAIEECRTVAIIELGGPSSSAESEIAIMSIFFCNSLRNRNLLVRLEQLVE